MSFRVDLVCFLYLIAYDVTSHLILLSRPLNVSGQRVSPIDLGDHCESHKILRPCCLCPFNDASNPYLQASFFQVTCGVHVGEFVVRCASPEDSHSSCGYLGKRLQISSCQSIHVSLFYLLLQCRSNVYIRKLLNKWVPNDTEVQSYCFCGYFEF